MAKRVQTLTHGANQTRIHAHLCEHLANYAQYFYVEQRSTSEIVLQVREVVPKRREFQRSGFFLRVLPSGTGCRVVLYRTLAPLGRYFFIVYSAAMTLLLAWGLTKLWGTPLGTGAGIPVVATAVGLLLAGAAMRELVYWLERGRDRELSGILQKALADYGRPTAIRRARASAGGAAPGVNQRAD